MFPAHMETPTNPDTPSDATAEPKLQRGIGMVQATALNMSNMVGIGPFVTIPALMTALGGPQAMLGWAVALVVALADGLVWSELGAAKPGSGGSYVFLRDGLGSEKWGRLVSFLFIWQFLISGPLEIGSGFIGFAQYLRYLWPGGGENGSLWAAAGVAVLMIYLLYRPIQNIGRLMVGLWLGTLITIAAVIFTGATHFNPQRAFDFPPNAWAFNSAFLIGLGAAARIGMYDYLGYYNVCHLGDEVRNPGRVIPRSMLISLVAVAVLYLGINLSIIGIVSWREFVPADPNSTPPPVVSWMMERVWGSGVAGVFTVFVLITAFACCFAMLLGYSRIPYAAARDGNFFKVFGRLHPTGAFPHVSLVVLGLLSVVSISFSLQQVIDALLTTRIAVQFCGQIVALVVLRKTRPDLPRPFRMWLYPLPALIAFVGWNYLLFTTDKVLLAIAGGVLVAGVGLYLGVALKGRHWPFQKAEAP
jgi:amino acid transporter